MDKKLKRNRQKVPARDELMDLIPPQVSFDTAEGRAAHGMKPEIGQGLQGRPDANVPDPRARPQQGE